MGNHVREGLDQTVNLYTLSGLVAKANLIIGFNI